MLRQRSFRLAACRAIGFPHRAFQGAKIPSCPRQIYVFISKSPQDFAHKTHSRAPAVPICEGWRCKRIVYLPYGRARRRMLCRPVYIRPTTFAPAASPGRNVEHPAPAGAAFQCPALKRLPLVLLPTFSRHGRTWGRLGLLILLMALLILLMALLILLMALLIWLDENVLRNFRLPSGHSDPQN